MWTPTLTLRQTRINSECLAALKLGLSGEYRMKGPTLGIWSTTICSMCLIGMIMLAVLCGPVSLNGQQIPARTDTAFDDLHQIGMKILGAVLKKDAVAVLGYEPARERADHEIALKDKSSDLYCFLIDSHSSCTRIPGGGSWPPSVFELVAGARQPGIAIIGADKPQPDGIRWGVLLFYDRSTISERSIRSFRFLCGPASFHKYASWSFKLVDGKWESVGELFNFETDAPC
jgi:hypothetical protein